MDKRIVISLGGSLALPNEIDINFLKKFKRFIERYVRFGFCFVIVVGGGSVARKYQKAAQKIGALTRDDLDWLGIHATRLNAHLLRTVFKRIAYSHVVTDPTKKEGSNYSVIIASGWKPGWSTDYDSVLLAKTFGAKTILNLSNISYVYSRDPKKNKNAKPLKNLLWKDFRKIVGNRWDPGANLPFDPVASKLAERFKFRVIILNGKNLKNVSQCIAGKSFIGTEIK